MNIYYLTVRFTGSPYVEPTPANNNSGDGNNTPETNDTFEPTKITFNITAIDWKSKG